MEEINKEGWHFISATFCHHTSFSSVNEPFFARKRYWSTNVNEKNIHYNWDVDTSVKLNGGVALFGQSRYCCQFFTTMWEGDRKPVYGWQRATSLFFIYCGFYKLDSVCVPMCILSHSDSHSPGRNQTLPTPRTQAEVQNEMVQKISGAYKEHDPQGISINRL